MIGNRLSALLAAICLLTVVCGGTVAAAGGLQLRPEAAADKPDGSGETEASESGLRPVQVFDVARSQVVKSIPNDAKFQKMAAAWIASVTGPAPQVSAGEGCSHVYRVPLEKPATVAAGTIKVTTSDLFLFYCKDKPPLLLAFDDQRKPYLFLFKEDIRRFVQRVGLPENID